MSELTVNTRLLRKILVGFIREEVGKVGLNRAVLGLSGGIDSALVAYLAVEALGPENVHACIMPYRTSNPESEAHARLMAGELGINFDSTQFIPFRTWSTETKWPPNMEG